MTPRATDAKAQLVGAGDPVINVADGMLTARLGELAPGTVRTVRFATRASSAGGALPVRALAVFDSPAKSGLRIAAGRIAAVARRGALRAFAVHLHAALRRAQDRIVAGRRKCAARPDPQLARCARHHAFAPWATPIRSRSAAAAAKCSPTTTRCHAPARRRWPTTWRSRWPCPSRACTSKGAAPMSRWPRARTPASHAANRRVEIVIEGSRFEANAPLELNAAGGKAETIATQGVILRGPSTGAKRAPRSAASDDKLGMGVVLDVDTLKPGVGWLAPLADATPRDFGDQGRHPASPRPDRGAHRERQAGGSAVVRRRERELGRTPWP